MTLDELLAHGYDALVLHHDRRPAALARARGALEANVELKRQAGAALLRLQELEKTIPGRRLAERDFISAKHLEFLRQILGT